MNDEKLDLELAHEIAAKYADPRFETECIEAIYNALQGRRITAVCDALDWSANELARLQQGMTHDRYAGDGS